ncbi:hypothetical protein DB32_005214 [Sandaracinus amylolyticus]|uniref:Uncharacterized protein n=2 Tax=Sandaracinus amylolyticus TaxID=927083 RepID=A0A0F6W5W1_9BACT|nr:hypothetical protein DB32_005214 [Sandaracinus amylolyticus]
MRARRLSRTDVCAVREEAMKNDRARAERAPSWMPKSMGTASAAAMTAAATVMVMNGVGALAPTPFFFAGIGGFFAGGIGGIGLLGGLVLLILVLVVLVLIGDDCGRPA